MRHLLPVFFQVLRELWNDLLVLLQVNERGGYTLAASSACTTDAMHVVSEGGWCLVVYHMRHPVNVNASGSHVSANKYFGFPVFD